MKRQLLPLPSVRGIALALLLAPLGVPTTSFAQKYWIGADGNGGDGAWVAGNFSPSGLPNTGTSGNTNQVIFDNIAGIGQQTTEVSIGSGVNARARSLVVRNKMDVTFRMADTSSFTINNQTIDVGGHSSATPQASSSSLTFSGPESGLASINVNRIYMENNTNVGTLYRNTLRFEGNLDVYISASSSAYTNLAGRVSLLVEGGASIRTNSADGNNGASAWYIRNGARSNGIYDIRLGVLDGQIDGSYFRVESLLQMGREGSINLAAGATGLKVEVRNNGRFEAAGSGLSSDALLEIQNGGTLAIGLTDQTTGKRTEAATFTLNNAATMASNSTLELTLFGSGIGEADSIIIGEEGSLLSTAKLVLNIAEGATISYGTTWNLFSVAPSSSGVSGNFDLSAIDTSLWDLTYFNEAGNWQVVAIPEPSTYALLALTGIAAFAFRRSRK